MNDREIVFVCDLYEEQYAGGAELTTGALIEYNKTNKILKLHSGAITASTVKNNKNKKWIIGNFANLNNSVIHRLIKEVNYSILEYDYKFCIHRNPSLHSLKSGCCDCSESERAKLINLFFYKAAHVFYMSEKQKNIYASSLKKLEEGIVLGSVFRERTLDFIDSLPKDKNNKWLIYDTENYLKGTKNSVDHALSNGLDYQLFKNLSHEKTLMLLSKSKGLIFLPNGEDTCPRLVIEAKLCGCEVISNEKVQHLGEEWTENAASTMQHMRTRAKHFWDIIDESL